MKASEVRPCDVCQKGLIDAGGLTFHRITFSRLILDMKSVRERVGLSLIFNNRAPPALIEAFASHDDLAVLIDEPATLIVCEVCACTVTHVLFQFAEIAHARLQERKLSALPSPSEEPHDHNPNGRGSTRPGTPG